MHQRARNSLNNLLPLLIAAFVIAPSAVSQTPSTTDAPAPITYDQVWTQALAAQAQYSADYATIGFVPAILTIPGQPFTAQRVYTQWDPTDGSPSNPDVTTTVTIARDNQGRIHFESSLTPGAVAITVSDPIAKVYYRYTAGQPASVQLVAAPCGNVAQANTAGLATPVNQPAPTSPAPAAAPPIPASPLPGKQDLGTQTIQGTLAYGQSNTTYLSLDTVVKTFQTEDWFSPSLGLNLHETTSTSGQATQSIETNQLQLGDPDPSLFVLPSGYTLPDQAASCAPQSS